MDINCDSDTTIQDISAKMQISKWHSTCKQAKGYNYVTVFIIEISTALYNDFQADSTDLFD